MKIVFQRILMLAMTFAMILTMTAAASGTEYHIDDIATGDVVVLHAGDTIAGSEADDIYFTVIDRIGNYWANPANESSENSFYIDAPASIYGENKWRIFGPDSTFQVGNIAGFYSFPVTADEAKIETVDQNGKPITVRILLLADMPEDPIVYTISYDANGGEGAIASHQWEYMERGKALSDGIGFTRTGYDLIGWTLPGAVDAESNPIVWSLGESLDLGPGENIVGTKIPAYASETIDGKADITFQAVWERNGDPLEEDLPDSNPDTDNDTDIDTDADIDTDSDTDADIDTDSEANGDSSTDTETKEDTDNQKKPDSNGTSDDAQEEDKGIDAEAAPKTSDMTALFLYAIILTAALGCILRFRQQK